MKLLKEKFYNKSDIVYNKISRQTLIINNRENVSRNTFLKIFQAYVFEFLRMFCIS